VTQDLAAISGLLKQRDLAAARDALSSALTERPDDADVADLQAELLLLERRPESALQAVRRALRLGGETTGRLGRLGRCLNNLGDLIEAERAFRRVVEMEAGNPDGYANLGHILRRQRRFQEAEEALLKALDLESEHVGALRTLGMLRLATGTPAAAAEVFRRAVSNAPDQPGLQAYLGIALHRSGDLAGAEEAYRRALEVDDSDVETWLNLGITLQDRDRLDAAIEAYEEAGLRAPGNAAPRHRLAEALMIAGHPDRALAAAKRADELDPGHPTGVAVRIAALQALDRRDEADALLGLDSLVTSIDLECPPGFPDVSAFNTALARHVLAHPTLSYEPEGHATRRGRHTRDLLLGDKGPVAALEAEIRNAADGYLERLQPPPGHPFPGFVPRPHRLTMWAVVMDTEGHQLPHIHPAAWLSGVYYVELPDSLGAGGDDVGGWIEFGLAPDELRRGVETPVRLFKPAEGRMCLFPSYLYHRTIPFAGEHRRISIAFDLLRKPGS
jgi:tetratricopeptide (TPR) repeat protein